MVTIRYHGNYVGPGWSAGKYQKSVVSAVPPVDEFDRTGMEHDFAYAKGLDLKEADYEFYRANWGKGVKRSVAAAAVGLQGYFRKKQTNHSSSSNAPVKKKSMPKTTRRKARQITPPDSTGKRKTPYLRKAKKRMLVRTVSIPVRKRVTNKRKSSSKKMKMSRRRGSAKSFGRIYGKGGLTPKVDRFQKHGIVFCDEKTIEIAPSANDAVQSVTLIHSNYTSRDVLLDYLSFTFAKALLVKYNILWLNDVTQPVFGGATGSKMFVDFYYQDLAIQQPINSGRLTVTATTTYLNVKDAFRTYFNILVNDSRYKPLYLSVQVLCAATGPLAVPEKFNLYDAQVEIFSKSSMKFQNRTKADITTGDVADDTNVFNQPLYGKYYFGKGNYVAAFRQGLVAEGGVNIPGFWQETGITTGGNHPCNAQKHGYSVATGTTVAAKVAALQNPWIEPPSRGVLKNCIGVGKIGMLPGQIKTSVLNHSEKISLDLILQKIGNNNSSAGQFIQNWGYYRAFCFEKLMRGKVEDATASLADTKNQIAVTLECDYKIGMIAKFNRSFSTTMVNSSNPIAPNA